MHLNMPYHLLCIHDTYVVHIHAIRVPEGVTLLEYEQDQPEEQQTAQEQEVQVAGKEANKDDLPEFPDHQPASFLKGKPWSILSFLCLTNHNLSISV
jgi:hypothetical protein